MLDAVPSIIQQPEVRARTGTRAIPDGVYVGAGKQAKPELGRRAACCRCKNLGSHGADITSRLIPPRRLLGLPLRLGLLLVILILTALLMLLPARLRVALPFALFISHWTRSLLFIHIEKSPWYRNNEQRDYGVPASNFVPL